jgi:hypothetical protein
MIPRLQAIRPSRLRIGKPNYMLDATPKERGHG